MHPDATEVKPQTRPPSRGESRHSHAGAVYVDPSVWYFGRFFVMALMTAVAGYAFIVSLAAQPVFNLALLEED